MLHLDFNSYTTDKSFIEVRFKDSFKLPLTDTRYKILDKMSKKYSQHHSENPELLSFLDQSRQQQLHIQLNRIVIDWDKPNSLGEFIKSAVSDLTFVLKLMEVNEIIRIGFRTLHSFQSNSQEAIDQFIFKEYLTSKFKSQQFADHYFNPRVQFSGKKGASLFNLAMYYQQEQTIESSFDPRMPIINKDVRDLLTVDLDGFRENFKVQKLQTVLNDLKELNDKLPDYIKSLRNDKYELSK
ncbi:MULTISPECIES: hypothetical protein [unclassified Peribacillus]|uniref:hypothetical protein n=1 Tax=unclassified Peribacillus TaxID=2675266 RepID=UPI00366FD42F